MTWVGEIVLTEKRGGMTTPCTGLPPRTAEIGAFGRVLAAAGAEIIGVAEVEFIGVTARGPAGVLRERIPSMRSLIVFTSAVMIESAPLISGIPIASAIASISSAENRMTVRVRVGAGVELVALASMSSGLVLEVAILRYSKQESCCC